MQKTILLIGTYDTKGADHQFLRERIQKLGCDVRAMDVGVVGEPMGIPVDHSASEVAAAGDTNLESLRRQSDRGAAMQAMSRGAAVLARKLYEAGKVQGAIGMGGSGGSSVICSALRALPLGVPKVCVSTIAGSDTSGYVGTQDIVMIPAVADIAGVNRFSKVVYTQAAGAICGMVQTQPPAVDHDKPLVVASMFGNTTQCVGDCRHHLLAAGYEVLIFHAVGTGGRTMEALIEAGHAAACLDLTTTEWADEICGGVFSAGKSRLSAAGQAAIPQVLAPGCIDMVNFGDRSTVPEKYRSANRLFYEWNPNVTLMRTNANENQELGRIFAAKANVAKGPVAILLPKRGYSMLGGPGQVFCDPAADQAFADALRKDLESQIELIEVDANINAPEFSSLAARTLTELLR